MDWPIELAEWRENFLKKWPTVGNVSRDPISGFLENNGIFDWTNRWEMDAFRQLAAVKLPATSNDCCQRIMQICLRLYRIITLKKRSKVHWKFRRVDEYFSEIKNQIPARRWWRHRRPKKAAEIEKNYSEKRPLRSKNAFLISCRQFSPK